MCSRKRPLATWLCSITSPPGCGPACLCTSCLLRERLLHPPALTGLRPTSCSWVVRGRNPLKLAQRKQEQPSAEGGGPGPSSLHLGPRGLCLRSACLLSFVGCPGSRGPCPCRSTACTLLYPPLWPHFSTTFRLSFSQLTDLTLGPLCRCPTEVGLLPSYPSSDQ